jgi:hypothetical protein
MARDDDGYLLGTSDYWRHRARRKLREVFVYVDEAQAKRFCCALEEWWSRTFTEANCPQWGADADGLFNSFLEVLEMRLKALEEADAHSR